MSGFKIRRATEIVDVWGGPDHDKNNLIRLCSSPIAGIGAFAKQDLSRHATIGEYTSERILSCDDLYIRHAEYDRGQIGNYVFELEEDLVWLDTTFSRCAV